jgi:F0F1-type ATP synthase membrane subunit c/vacuolar-type H+-ATPase subunit K
MLTGLPVAASASRWADILTITLGPAGLVVSLAGLGYAIHQIRKTKTAAEAAATSAERTSRALVQNHLLFLIPELTRLVSEIDIALAALNDTRAGELFGHWRNAASRTRGLLRARGEVPRPLAAAFTGAFTAITETRARLREPNPNLVTASQPALRAIDKVMDEIGDLGGQMLGDPQGAD